MILEFEKILNNQKKRSRYENSKDNFEMKLLAEYLLEKKDYMAKDLVYKIKNYTKSASLSYNVFNSLKEWNLLYYTDRLSWIEKLEEVSENISILLYSKNQEKINNSLDDLKNYFFNNKIPAITYKSIFVLLEKKYINNDTLKENIEKKLRKENNHFFFLILKEYLATIETYQRKENNDIRKINDFYYEKMKSNLVYEVKEKNFRKNILNEKRDLKSSLEITEKQNETLKKELENKIENIEDETLINILKNMNSEKYSQIINNVYESNETLKKLKKDGKSLPMQYNFLSLSLKMLKKFFDDLDLEQINKKDEILDINQYVTEDYVYIGTPFQEDEIKHVMVEKVGWKYKGHIISKPHVKEYNN
ncbi:MAG: hypothetical protein PWP28_2642 [Oceanotoga sp.]|jgi:hypothetical protein|uniref:hypothetical protein n=1 Tax=Oceanotoga sp. TaxID=2108366 RepID=UPI00264F52B0|nr:hypothetical protein [Oceanotoga sp.]MDN5343762.1 hypothetical protein [Oceanotoga sp.]